MHLLGPRLGEAELERRLDGWDELCGQPASLEWLLARIQDPDDPAPKRRFGRDRRGGIVSLGGPAPSAA